MGCISSSAFRAMLLLLAAGPISSGAWAQTKGSDASHVRMKWQDFANGPSGAKRVASLQAAVAMASGGVWSWTPGLSLVPIR